MKKEYDEKIEQHYTDVAKEYGLSSSSTMEDKITRNLETEQIVKFVRECLRIIKARSPLKQATIMDVGCGNGYTLDVLFNYFPDQIYFGIEKSDDLRSLAASRFQEKNNIKILKGDIREKHFAKNITVDILICQRVLINLLEIEDQRRALNNILNTVISPSTRGSGGFLLFIESFIDSLARLNNARREFDLPAIAQAYHNLYLPVDFFKIPQLRSFKTDRLSIPPNFLSTHYYVTRVLHPIFNKNKVLFKRNSEFVKFFTYALNGSAGDYSPLRLYMFRKADAILKRSQPLRVNKIICRQIKDRP